MSVTAQVQIREFIIAQVDCPYNSLQKTVPSSQ